MTRKKRNLAGGFTLMELLIVAVLMTGLSVIIGQMWRSFAVDMTELAARARLAQELRLGVETLSEDLGSTVGVMPLRDRLLLCRDGGAFDGQADWEQAEDRLVEYRLSEGQLVRTDLLTGNRLVACNFVSGFDATWTGAGAIRVVLAVKRAGLERQVTLHWSEP